MNKKIVFVNNTAAVSGGALTILKQFLEEIIKRNKNNIIYYVFVSIDLNNYNSENLFIINNIKGKKFLDRIIWDRFGIKKWAEDNNIKPDLIVSLQNIAVKFDNVPQIVYIHQPLPYAKEYKWSLMKRDERILWFYKNIYKYFIHNSFNIDTKLIVQTNWMKRALINQKIDSSNIIVQRPYINKINIEKIDCIKKDKKYRMFYPASEIKYKNHKIIIQALNILKVKNKDMYDNIELILTLEKESDAYNLVQKYNLNCIKFVGKLDYEKVMQYYKSSDIILFPSYIETFGLPLVEAIQFNKKILVADCDYSREVIGDYENVEFINYNDDLKWCNKIIDTLKNSENFINLKIKEYIVNNEDGWNDMFNIIEKI